MDRYLEELRATGVLDSARGFSLDQHKALERPRQYRLPEPYYYIVPLVAWTVATLAILYLISVYA